jgi:hypothetical protein
MATRCQRRPSTERRGDGDEVSEETIDGEEGRWRRGVRGDGAGPSPLRLAAILHVCLREAIGAGQARLWMGTGGATGATGVGSRRGETGEERQARQAGQSS